MADRGTPHNPTSDLEHTAAGWVLRCDRGLTATEQDELSEWLAADPRHGPALARHRQLWRRLDRLTDWRPEHGAGPNPDLLAPPVRRGSRVLPFVTAGLLAAAAAFVFFLRTGNEPEFVAPEAPPIVAAGESVVHRTLPDGSTAELNRGAVIAVEYAAGERRVRLTAGEAHFTVTRDVERPFVVVAGDVRVRAVGTAFNVRLGESAVEVLVTEGRVEVSEPESPDTPAAARAVVPILEARQRVVLSAASLATMPQVATLTAGEVERVLAWQHRLLDFTATPLAEVVAEFNRRNSVRLVLADPTLGAVPVSASFRSDNIEGFVALLEAGFGVRAERRGDGEILLRR